MLEPQPTATESTGVPRAPLTSDDDNLRADEQLAPPEATARSWD
jgi:hypothetical protein